MEKHQVCESIGAETGGLASWPEEVMFNWDSKVEPVLATQKRKGRACGVWRQERAQRAPGPGEVRTSWWEACTKWSRNTGHRCLSACLATTTAPTPIPTMGLLWVFPRFLICTAGLCWYPYPRGGWWIFFVFCVCVWLFTMENFRHRQR